MAKLFEFIISKFLAPDVVQANDLLVNETRRQIRAALKDKGAKVIRIDVYLDGFFVTTDIAEAQSVLSDLFKNSKDTKVEPADPMALIQLKSTMQRKTKKKLNPGSQSAS